MKQYKHFFPLFFLFFLIGCTSFFTQRTQQSFERPEPCQEFMNRLDAKVKEAGVRDGSNVPFPGFSYLRTNRFLLALKRNLKDDGEREAWIRLMQELDLKSRKKEIGNLPDKVVLSIVSKEKDQTDREGLVARMEACSFALLNRDQT